MRHRIAIPVVAVCLLVASAAAQARCTIAETALLGAWHQADGNGAFEQFELAREDAARVFRSWLHERPEVTAASWRYDATACRLRIDDGNDASWAYHVALDRRGALLLREAQGDAPPARYRRIPD